MAQRRLRVATSDLALAHGGEHLRDHADSATHVEGAREAVMRSCGPYPDLEPEDIREALRYAAEVVRERKLPLEKAL